MLTVNVARMAEQQRYLTQKEAAAYLRLSVRWLSAETVAGNIPVVRIGRRVTYLVEDLDEYVRRHRRVGGEEPGQAPD